MSKFERSKKIVLVLNTGVILILALLFSSCHTSSTAPSTTTNSTVTQSHAEDVIAFLDAAKNSYNTQGGDQLNAYISGISDADFLSLTVQNDTIILMDGKPYAYKVVSTTDQWLGDNPTFGNYTVTYIKPEGTPTGGQVQTVQVYEGTILIKEFSISEIAFQITNHSVYINAYTADKLLLLYMYYHSQEPYVFYERLWIYLLPI